MNFAKFLRPSVAAFTIIYALRQVKCFLPALYMKINSNQVIEINMIKVNLGCKTFDFSPATYMLSPVATQAIQIS